MKMHHTPSHWIGVALVTAAALLTLSEAGGQSSGAAAVFEGRPAMAGAQGGLGAQGGMPQGGLGVQGSEAAEAGLKLNRPAGLDAMPPGRLQDLPAPAIASRADLLRARQVQRDRTALAKEQRSAARKAKRAAKRSISRARHGVSEIDSASALPGAR